MQLFTAVDYVDVKKVALKTLNKETKNKNFKQKNYYNKAITYVWLLKLLSKLRSLINFHQWNYYNKSIKRNTVYFFKKKTIVFDNKILTYVFRVLTRVIIN